VGRPVTLFTGQWADLTLDEVAARAAKWGFDGLDLRAGAIISKSTRHWPICLRPGRWRSSSDTASTAGPSRTTWWAGGLRPESTAAQAFCLPTYGAMVPGGVRQRAAKKMMTPRVPPHGSVKQVNGFTAQRLAHAVFVSANGLGRGRASYADLPSAGTDHRRLRQGGRALRPRGAPDRDRLRLSPRARTLDAIGRGRVSHQLRSSHFAQQSWTRQTYVQEFGRSESTTFTSKTRRGCSTGGGDPGFAHRLP